jgi:outer membrane protein
MESIIAARRAEHHPKGAKDGAMMGIPSPARWAARCCLAITLMLAGSPAAPAGAPPSPDKPWQVANSASYAAEVRASDALSSVRMTDGKAYELAELIDIAQRTNPETRVAWENARQAAIRGGMVESTYYPILAIHAAVGYERLASTISKTVSPRGFFIADAEAIRPTLTLKWLLFDFGGRDASLAAANEQLAAANFGFNARHQKIVFDVTRAYYKLNAVRSGVDVARSALGTAQTVQQASESRLRQGLATLPEVLQAREQAARAAYDVEEASASEVDARMALLEAMGVRPSAALSVADLYQRPLPASLEAAADKFVDAALENRPDLLARVAALRAKDAEIRKARSEYYPRITALGNLGQNIGRVRVDSGPWSTVNEPQYGFAIALELPLFDAGLRNKRLALAQSERRAAEDELNLARDRTIREVVKAYDDVKVAFRKREAAVALLAAADRAYVAALQSYRRGVGTYIDVATAQTHLTRARTSDTETRALVFTASAALAFSTGEITPPLPADAGIGRSSR